MGTLATFHRALRSALAAGVALAVSASATSLPAALPGDALPPLPTPAHAQASRLGDRLRINGQEARLHELRYAGSVDELLAFYREQFGATASEPRGMPGQRIVGGVVGASYVTVQVQEATDRSPDAPVHARVLQTVLQPRSAAPSHRAAASMPADSRLLSDVESQDGDRLARLSVYGNRHSLEANLAFVQRRFESRGLVPVERGAQDDATGALLWFADEHGGEAMVAVRSVGELRLVTVHTVAQLPAFEAPR